MPKYLDMHGLETLTGEIENTYLKKKQRGAAGGVASLNSSGKVPSSQLPDTGTSDYSDLTNKPRINGVTLYGNKTSANLGIANAENPVFTGSMSMGRVENTTVGEKSTATGTSVTASGSNSHAEGGGTTASGAQSHAEGGGTTASGSNSHSEGAGSEATNSSAHAEGTRTTASGDSSHSEGSGTTASGYSAHAEGAGTTASGSYSHAEGASTIAASGNAHAEGGGTQANAGCAHAEGSTTRANGSNSHSEGGGTIANGDCAHAEGSTTQANGASSHAEGGGTVANGACSHVGGRCNVPDDYSSWAEWVANTNYAVGDKAKRTITENNETTVTGYICKTPNNDSTFDSSKWDIDLYMNYAEIIGNGSLSVPSNARTLDWDGNEELAGDLTLKKGTADEFSVSELKTEINSGKDKLESLAENGYYEESGETKVYIPTQRGQYMDQGSGNPPAFDNNGYTGNVLLTSEQEQKTIEFDDSVFKYSLVYLNNGNVVSTTSWILESPVVLGSNSTYDQVIINIRRLDSASLSSEEFAKTLSYTESGTIVGNLATKDYVDESTTVDNTLEVPGKASDSKSVGDRINEVVLNGFYIGGNQKQNIPTSQGMIYDNKSIEPTENTTSYVKLTAEQETALIYFDTTKYKVNTAYFNGDTNTRWTSWITESPVELDMSVAHTEIYINVRKLSGVINADDLNGSIYYFVREQIGDLATKRYVDSLFHKGTKYIYPDVFESRIKPDIYYDGEFYADIDIESYKISGDGEVWVATDGNDSTGDGSEDNPYATITKALTLSAKTIHVKAGTYTQDVHYSKWFSVSGRNVIGHGEVVFQNDSAGHAFIFLGNNYVENIIFKHGHATTNPAVSADCSGSGETICFVGCTFRDGGTNGISVYGIDAVVVGCIAFGNRLDGFNYHKKTISSVEYLPNVIEINCTAYNNGSSSSENQSCNGSTSHDGSKIIRLNGEYYSCYGGIIADTGEGSEPTISVNFGVCSHDGTGEGVKNASFWASTDTKMYLYDCFSYGSTYDITAENDGYVVSRRLTTGRDVPSVSKASRATVLQY